MRIRGAKTELEEAGLETEGMVDSTAKLRSEILALSGVDIMENANEFKSTYKIMDELAAKWENLTDIQQATVTELIAGKRQGNIVSSLMTNFDTAREALETSMNSAGSAMREHEKWQQSLEAQINSLKASWQSLSQAFLKSDFLKVALNAVIGLVDGLTKLMDTFGTLPTLLGTVAAGFSLFKNKGLFTFDKDAKSIQLLGNNLLGLKDHLGKISTAIGTYNSNLNQSTDLQNAYIDAIGRQNSGLGKYLSGLNGAKASFSGYISSLVGATIKTIALEAATMALNAALTMGVSFLISAAIKAISEWIVTEEELAEKVEEVTSKFKEQHAELQKLKGDYDTTNESSMISKYEKLSKGVDNLGRNVSLTADEYSEYQSIVNQIAEQIPSLVTGYDSQGNALLSCKGNVEELTEAYQKLIHAQNTAILSTNASDIEKNFANTIKKASGKGSWSDNHGFWAGIAESAGIVGLFSENYDLKNDTAKRLEKLLNPQTTESDKEKIYDEFVQDKFSKEELRTALERANVDIGYFDNPIEVLKETLKTDPSKIKGIVENFYAQFDDEVEKQKTIARAKLSEAFDISSAISGLDYGNISDELQTLAYQVVNGLDLDFFTKLQEEGKTVEQWTTEMLDQFNSLSETDSSTLETAFNLKTQFNDGEVTYGEYAKGIQNAKDIIDGLALDDEVKQTIKLSLDDSEIETQYNHIRGYLRDFYADKDTRKMDRDEEYDYKFKVGENDKKVEEFLNSLTAEELTAVIDLRTEIDWENTSAEDIRKQIEDQVKLNEALNFTIAIDVEAEGVEALNTALTESVSATGLSSESIAALKSRYAELESEGYNLSAMFEETANGIHLNREAVSELEQKLASNKLAETDKQLEVLKGRYDELTTEINNCKDAGDRAALYTEQQSIVDKINDLATLASQYEGLTSAYNAWQNAESAGQERDMYESIIEGFENVGDEISRGWIDDGTIKFLELLTGKTGLAGKSGKDLKKIYDDLDNTIKNTTYSVRDFFTVDEDGNSTNTGVYNFLDAIGQLEEEKFGGKDVVKRDKDGNVIGFDFELAGGDEVIAEALGVSEELVQIMVRAADDAGFVVNLEGAYTQLADLKTEAESARDTLISLQKNGLEKLKGVDVNFNLDAEGNDLVTEQEKAVKLLDKFKKDGKIDLTMEGAQQALDVAEYLTIKLDDLTEPRYMQIDATQVEEDIREPLEDMQEFERLSKEKHLLQLTGDKKKIKEVQDDMDEIADGLEDLDKETKVKLGIDGLTSEEIADKLEKGEIEIPAELNIDVQMSDDLKDMRLMMMNQLGLVSDNEVKLKIGYEIDDSVVDKLTEEEKEVVVNYLANDEDVKDYTPEQKEALVKYIADGGDLEGFTPEEKEAFVNYLVDGGSVEGYTPEDKKALAKYLVDGGDPDNYQPPSKTQNVKADLDSSEPDNYQPADKTMTIWARIKKVASSLWGWVTGNKGSTRNDSNGYSDVNGTANVDGTAFANGTSGRAFKQGNWRTKKTETALTGELGQELVVTGNRWYTVGDNGAEFATIPKGSIVFNHKQTEEIFKNGKVTSGGGRGKALASGTAFSSGSGGIGKIKTPKPIDDGSGGKTKVKTKTDIKAVAKDVTTTTTTTTTTSNGSNNSSIGSSGSGGTNKVEGSAVGSEDKFEETFDWVAIAIERIEREIDNLDKKVNNTYKSWGERNTALAEEITKVGKEIKLQDDAATEYWNRAGKSLDHDSDYAKKIRAGTLNIEDVTNEDDAEKIKEYQKWYELYLDCTDAAEDLKQTEAELYAQRFENVQSQYDAILQGFEHTESMLNEYISQAEAKGHIVSKNYYEALKTNKQFEIDKLKEEQLALIAKRDEAEANGVAKYSEEWYNMCAEIDGVTQAIEAGETALIEYDNAIRDIDWQVFDLIQERISDVTSEANFLIDLMSNDKLFDDNGNLTDKGIATMGLHGQNYNTYMYQADDYGAKVKEIDAQIADDPYDQELINKRREYIELQRECILNAEDEKQAIVDLVEEGINLELDALQERIDKHNEELDSMKDLYDYQKKVKEQTEEIASLEKQVAAYSGDDSEEAKAKVQELKVSLEDAKENLQESEYDRYISDQSALLDGLFLEYENVLNTRLDNTNGLISQVIDGVNAAAGALGAEGTITSALGAEGAIATALGANATTIKTTLENEVKSVGTTLSTAMSDIWNAEGSGNKVITMYGQGFQQQQTTTNGVLNSIKASIDRMVDDIDKDATTKVNDNPTKPSSVVDPTKGTNQPKKEEPKKENKPNITNDTLKGIAAAIWVHGKSSGWGNNPFRENKLTNKLGAANAKKVQDIVNKYGKSGELYNFWLKKNKNLNAYKYKAFKSGARDIDETQFAWTQENGQEFIVRPSDGAILTPIAKGDSVLTSAASNNIWDMANSPAEFIKDNLSLGATNVPNNSNVQSNYTQNLDKVVFNLPNVHNYEEFLSAMQKDKNFERLIKSMTIDQIAGKSSLAKGKSIR